MPLLKFIDWVFAEKCFTNVVSEGANKFKVPDIEASLSTFVSCEIICADVLCAKSFELI